MRKSAGIFLFDKTNRMLVEHPTNHDPNFWSIPKGMVEKYEDEFDAAKRETLEETSLDIDSIKVELLSFLPDTKINKRKMLVSFLLRTPEDLSEYPFRCDSMVTFMGGKDLEHPFPEVDDFKWVTIEEAFPLLHRSQVEQLQFIVDNNLI